MEPAHLDADNAPDMNTHGPGDDGGPEAEEQVIPPHTGNREIDEALQRLQLGQDVHTHQDALAAAIDAVQRALNPGEAGPRPTS